MCEETIGTSAGKVWQHLKEHGPATAKAIQKATGDDAALTHQAIGWLAREGKLAFGQGRKKADPTYALRE